MTQESVDGLSEVAVALREADWIIVAAGAGFSADSGLPTYEDCRATGVEYEDLCRPELLYRDPAAAYGFWASSVVKYRQVEPHQGYRILERLLRPFADAGRAYIYTSNVDGHFRHLKGLPICEIHGCCEEWMCSAKLPYAAVELSIDPVDQEPCASDPSVVPLEGRRFIEVREIQQNILASHGREHGCKKPLILSPPEFWDVPMEPDSMRACLDLARPCSAKAAQTDWTHTPPVCECGLPLRPCVLMFGDEDAELLRHLQTGQTDYQQWEDSMEDAIEANGKGNVVILELGVGKRVDVVRQECLAVLYDVASKGGNATLVRMNPDPTLHASEMCETSNTSGNQRVICLQMSAIEGLQKLEVNMAH